MKISEVAILLSTYNGELFLAEQLNSIIAQTFTDWKLYIRDDGSSDRTIDIIQKFVSLDDRILFLASISEENLGVKASFFKLLMSVDSDYYMFCDQDDVWKPDKIELTLNKIKDSDNNRPAMVFTDLAVVDKQLNPINGSMMRSQNLRFHNQLSHLLVQNSVTGCTMLFNKKLKEKIKDTDVRNMLMHDWWLALVASCFGEINYLDKRTILYRQHGNNTVGFQSLSKQLTSSNIEKRVITSIAHTIIQANEFKKCYCEDLQGNNKEIVETFCHILERAPIKRISSLIKYKLYKKGTLRNMALWVLLLTKKEAIKRIIPNESKS